MINPFETNTIDCFLSCPRGLEEITAENIKPYCNNVTVDKGGVQFSGDMESLYNVNLHSRTGMHALVRLLTFKARTENELYDSVLKYPWHDWITPVDTISIRARAFKFF